MSTNQLAFTAVLTRASGPAPLKGPAPNAVARDLPSSLMNSAHAPAPPLGPCGNTQQHSYTVRRVEVEQRRWRTPLPPPRFNAMLSATPLIIHDLYLTYSLTFTRDPPRRGLYPGTPHGGDFTPGPPTEGTLPRDPQRRGLYPGTPHGGDFTPGPPTEGTLPRDPPRRGLYPGTPHGGDFTPGPPTERTLPRDPPRRGLYPGTPHGEDF
ncbi:unnamed protein product [Gadus morhua 'NCC']